MFVEKPLAHASVVERLWRATRESRLPHAILLEGPRGTGKSHLFQQVSPYAHLVSGGKATVAKMFVNNATGQRDTKIALTLFAFGLAPWE